MERDYSEGGTVSAYKGKGYEVIGCAKHSETEEEFVVYPALHGARGLWVRPIGMFAEHVMIEGKLIPRFTLLQEADKA